MSPGGAQAKVALTVKRTKPPTQASTPKPKVRAPCSREYRVGFGPDAVSAFGSDARGVQVPSCGPKHDVIKSWTVDKTDPNIVSLAKEGLLTGVHVSTASLRLLACP